MTSTSRDRVWLTHKRREDWLSCPLCGAPIKWVKVENAKYEWCPCDEEPVLVVTGKKSSKYKAVYHHELIDGCVVYRGRRYDGKPIMARMPHYFTCPPLIKSRREWATKNRLRYNNE